MARGKGGIALPTSNNPSPILDTNTWNAEKRRSGGNSRSFSQNPPRSPRLFGQSFSSGRVRQPPRLLRVLLFLAAILLLWQFSSRVLKLSSRSTSTNWQRSIAAKQPVPRYSIAPYTPFTEETAKYFLLDQQKEGSAPQRMWKQTVDWKYLGGNETREIEERFDTCLTYDNRYAPYSRPLSYQTVPPPPTAGSKTAIVYRVNSDWLVRPRDDLVLFMRGLIVEAQLGAGVDVWIVAYTDFEDEEERKEWREEIPDEFRERVLDFTLEEMGAPYPEGTFADIKRDNHASMDWFFSSKQGRQYEYAWYLEGDVRITGSWVTLFNHLNQTIPTSAPAPYAWETRTLNNTNYLDSLNNGGAWQPPFVIMHLVGGVFEKQWATYDTTQFDPCRAIFDEEDMAKAYIHMTGYSRDFNNVIKEHYKDGHSCFCEMFSISVAKRHKIPIWLADFPSWQKNGQGDPTFGHYKIWAAEPYYNDWRKDDRICRPGPALLHKVNTWFNI